MWPKISRFSIFIHPFYGNIGSYYERTRVVFMSLWKTEIDRIKKEGEYGMLVTAESDNVRRDDVKELSSYFHTIPWYRRFSVHHKPNEPFSMKTPRLLYDLSGLELIVVRGSNLSAGFGTTLKNILNELNVSATNAVIHFTQCDTGHMPAGFYSTRFEETYNHSIRAEYLPQILSYEEMREQTGKLLEIS